MQGQMEHFTFNPTFQLSFSDKLHPSILLFIDDPFLYSQKADRLLSNMGNFSKSATNMISSFILESLFYFTKEVPWLELLKFGTEYCLTQKNESTQRYGDHDNRSRTAAIFLRLQ